jgi:hypothetical protein
MNLLCSNAHVCCADMLFRFCLLACLLTNARGWRYSSRLSESADLLNTAPVRVAGERWPPARLVAHSETEHLAPAGGNGGRTCIFIMLSGTLLLRAHLR